LRVIPFLANLILDRQAAGSGWVVLTVFLIDRLWLVHVLDQVVDGGLLAHMAPLRAFRCFGHFNPPESLPAFSGVATLIAPVMTAVKTAPVKCEHLKTETCSGFPIAINPTNLVCVAREYL
jgi:hypothetical protein